MDESYDHRNTSVKAVFRSAITTGGFDGRNILVMPRKSEFHSRRGEVKTRFRAWRKHRRLSQEKVGERMGLSKASISRKETGAEGWNDAYLVALAEVLQVSDPIALLTTDPTQPDTPLSALHALSPADQAKLLDYAETLRKASRATDENT